MPATARPDFRAPRTTNRRRAGRCSTADGAPGPRAPGLPAIRTCRRGRRSRRSPRAAEPPARRRRRVTPSRGRRDSRGIPPAWPRPGTASTARRRRGDPATSSPWPLPAWCPVRLGAPSTADGTRRRADSRCRPSNRTDWLLPPARKREVFSGAHCLGSWCFDQSSDGTTIICAANRVPPGPWRHSRI